MEYVYEIVETTLQFPVKVWKYQFDMTTHMRSHWHEEIEVIYCLEGNYELWCDGVKRNVGQDEIIFINKNSIHKLRFFEKGAKLVTLLMSIRVFEIFGMNVDYYDFDPSRIDNLEYLKQLVLYLGNNANKKSLEIHNRMYEIYEFIWKYASVKKTGQITRVSMIKQITEYVQAHYTDDLTLTNIAEQFHFHEVYLSRMFKQKTGVTITEYINKVRLNHAYYDLMNTNMTISQIAYLHGFKNIKSFNKIFKKYYQQIPSQYRKS